ncbi:hypothetical protein [Trichocoleus sp. FACHB-262]
MSRAGIPLQVIQEISGHRSVACKRFSGI